MEINDTNAPAPSPEPITDAGPAPAPVPMVDELDAALAEFDRDNGAPAKPEPSPPEAAAEGVGEFDGLPKSAYERAAEEYQAAESRLANERRDGKHVDQLTRAVQELQQRQFEMAKTQWETLSRKDFESIVQKAHSDIEELRNLPPNFAEMFFVNEARLDPRLAEAWLHRYDSPEANAHAGNMIAKTLQKLGSAARSAPDPGATADREAVAHAMRSGAGKPPEPAAPNFGQMNDHEFDDYKRTKLGF